MTVLSLSWPRLKRDRRRKVPKKSAPKKSLRAQSQRTAAVFYLRWEKLAGFASFRPDLAGIPALYKVTNAGAQKITLPLKGGRGIALNQVEFRLKTVAAAGRVWYLWFRWFLWIYRSSRAGSFTPPSHRTVLDSLPSYGSSHLVFSLWCKTMLPMFK